jgi:Histidine kinase-, DNA gyrase B-, and HSP90-like ATPase
MGEESRLQRVFANLLENALRYLPFGSCVTLGAEIDHGFCKAYVDDQGPGLPRDLTPAQIFGLFSKGKQSTGKAAWACTSAVLASSAGVVPSVVSPCRRRVRASGSAFPWLLCKISPHAVSVPGNGKFQRLPPARLPSQGNRCAFFLLTITKTFES